jgi:hypothetical protein
MKARYLCEVSDEHKVLEPNFDPLTPAQNMFELLDNDRNGELSTFEIYQLFMSIDANQNYSVEPIELINWMMENEYTICLPFEIDIDNLLKSHN